MQSQQKQIKIPTNIAYNIQQLQSTTQTAYYLTLFTTNSNTYIIQANQSKPNILPTCLTNNGNFQIAQQNISKQNKKAILNKFSICSCDQVNEIMRKFFIINVTVQGYMGIKYNLLGFKYRFSLNYKKHTIVGVQQFQQIVLRYSEQSKEIWNNYNNKYCRSLNQKNKQNGTFSFGILPFLQFQVQGFSAPQFNVANTPGLYQYDGYNTSYQLLFPIQALPNSIKSFSTKLRQFLNQKIIQNSTTKQKLIKSWILSCPRAYPRKIFNPHTYIKYDKKQKYQLLTVKGIYQYYHYGDQGFNDNGWGCAYRALQTLISWLHIQGHTQSMSEMFSLKEIQQKLDRFDRSRKLKGSSTWIGATQISWLVPTITTNQINCKILHVSDGKHILEKCQQFKNHFLTSGCPIMYGGGQYAYSIVGMHYNWKLGQCQFLILDPHYTGEDDFGKIIEKKGLVWRKPEQMFKKGVFYNFCLPIIK